MNEQHRKALTRWAELNCPRTESTNRVNGVLAAKMLGVSPSTFRRNIQGRRAVGSMAAREYAKHIPHFARHLKAVELAEDKRRAKAKARSNATLALVRPRPDCPCENPEHSRLASMPWAHPQPVIWR